MPKLHVEGRDCYQATDEKKSEMNANDQTSLFTVYLQYFHITPILQLQEILTGANMFEMSGYYHVNYGYVASFWFERSTCHHTEKPCFQVGQMKSA